MCDVWGFAPSIQRVGWMTIKETSKPTNVLLQTMRPSRTGLAEKRAVKAEAIIGETTARFGTVSTF